MLIADEQNKKIYVSAKFNFNHCTIIIFFLTFNILIKLFVKKNMKLKQIKNMPNCTYNPLQYLKNSKKF